MSSAVSYSPVSRSISPTSQRVSPIGRHCPARCSRPSRRTDDGLTAGVTVGSDFTTDQKRYLEGFMSGLQVSRVARAPAAAAPQPAASESSGPDASHIKAQDRFVRAGQKLADQEKFKRELHPFDGYERLKA